MSGITVTETRGLRFVARCDFCGTSAEYAWLLFESSDGKNHICNECLMKMFHHMCDELEGDTE